MRWLIWNAARQKKENNMDEIITIKKQPVLRELKTKARVKLKSRLLSLNEIPYQFLGFTTDKRKLQVQYYGEETGPVQEFWPETFKCYISMEEV